MKILYGFILGLSIITSIQAQTIESMEGPIIKGFGEVWQIENQETSLLSHERFQLVFDIFSSPDDPSIVNTSINTIARYINMHAQSGVSIDKMDLVAVVHGTASMDILANQYYKSKKGVDNPNIELVKKLSESGVDFYICGQSMNARGLNQSELLPEIKISLSAMTTIHHFVKEGFVLIKF